MSAQVSSISASVFKKSYKKSRNMITLWKEITQAEVLIGPCFLIFRINYTYVFVSESIMYVSLSVFLVILSLIA